jgi:hypothetical protein
LAFDAAVLDGDAVVLDLIHFTQPMAECRNEIREWTGRYALRNPIAARCACSASSHAGRRAAI